MHGRSLPAVAERYATRFGFRPPLISQPPPADMQLCIVIPCYDEPHLIWVLDALRACHAPRHPVEVIVVINAGIHEHEVKRRNRKSLEAAEAWGRRNDAYWLKLHRIWVDDLPAKHAGVGLARKVGMDEALRRFAALENPGMIVCLDADCTVAPNYLQTLEQVQMQNAPASCTIHFEHRFEEVPEPALSEGIMYYELFLRYYVNALAYAGYPYSMHTIGSSMAVRADIYALSGGMNRRKAGEDFYFLHKVVPMGNFRNVPQTCVFPAARVSHRVPFGTGKAQQDWLHKAESRKYSYHTRTFVDLKKLMQKIGVFYQCDPRYIEQELQKLPITVQNFLQTLDFCERLKEMKANATTFSTFNKRFFTWFDGFKALKFVHYCRDHYYKQQPLVNVSNWLLAEAQMPGSVDPAELLRIYRQLDKERQVINLTDSSSA